VSKLEFGTQLCRAFGLDESLIRPTPVSDGGLPARRSRYMALDTSRLQALFPKRDFSIDAGIRAFRQCLENGYVRGIKGADWRFWGK
jgi:dTDP-4-dehydrorhamnose reductase